jgi:hypothetical protein
MTTPEENQTHDGAGLSSADLFGEAIRDAEKWGSALNSASWELLDAYRTHIGERETAQFFNMGKTMLRQCILKFLSEVEKNSSPNT